MATVLELFSGGGGFGLGFRRAGFDVPRAVENFKPRAETYRANFPDTELLLRDIQQTVIRDPYDVVIGGPPCEPYTPASSKRYPRPLDRLYKDKIGSLVLQFVRIVGDVHPKVFVMENVVQVAEGELRPELERLFGERGYPRVHFNELLAEHAGTPSHRRRLFISNVPLKIEPRVAAPTVGEALAGLPPVGSAEVENHLPHPLSPMKRQRLEALTTGEAAYGYTAGSGKRHQNWLRLDAARVAPTVLGRARFIHPTEDRLLTPREHARLMGFPDDFVLRGGRDQQYEVVGEAVPPPLAEHIARGVARALA